MALDHLWRHMTSAVHLFAGLGKIEHRLEDVDGEAVRHLPTSPRLPLVTLIDILSYSN
jgi:hypothetical protein